MASRNAFLVNWVKSAYGMELGLVPTLEHQTTQLEVDPELRKGLDLHLQKTRQHAELLRDYLQRNGENPASIRPTDPITKAYIRPNGGDPDRTRQNELIDYVNEAFEVASYRALSSLANMVGDHEASKVFEQILEDEIAITDVVGKRLRGHNGITGAEGIPERDNGGIARDLMGALNAHDLDRYQRYLTADFRLDSPGLTSPVNRDQALAMMQDGLMAFPDQHFDMQRVVSDGDAVVVEWIWTGTHTGTMRDSQGSEIAATGRKARIRGSTSLRFKDGKVTEERDYFDPNEMMQQLGVTPMQGQMSAGASTSAGRSVVHLEIPAADRKVAARFYNELFGWEYEHMPKEMRYTTFKTGTIAGGFADLADGYKPGDVTIYVACEDINADLRRAEKLGGKTLVPRTEIPGMGWYAILSDPTGNRVGLFSI